MVHHRTVQNLVFISLNSDMIEICPSTRDYFNYTLYTQDRIEIIYRLNLLDCCNNLMEELEAKAVITSNIHITLYDLNKFLTELSLWGRKMFNKESMKYHIRMYIPEVEIRFINGKLNAA
jgi:hypothetical protein